MVNVALLVRLEAKPGKEEEVESFLRGALPVVQEESEPVSSGNASKMPNVVGPSRIANHAIVSDSS